MDDATKRIIAHYLAFGPTVLPEEPETADAGITHEMLAAHRSPRPRFFLDTLSITGDAYLIPADRRMDWDAYDTEAEATSDPPPIPDYAVPVAIASHLEFENPQEVFK